jgi:broad specificity phosphatase PhoE
MATILLFRHGESQWNRSNRIQGQTDAASPLTLNGVQQARDYGRALIELLGADIGQWTIIGSPLARCVQTISVMCDQAQLDFDQVVFDDRLKEICCGDYAGKLRSEVEVIDPTLFKGKLENSWYFRCPNGETLEQISHRLKKWLNDRQQTEKLIVVTHGVASKVLRGLYGEGKMAQALAEDSPQNAYFVLTDGRIDRRNCTSGPA